MTPQQPDDDSNLAISDLIAALEGRLDELDFLTAGLHKNPGFLAPNAVKSVAQVHDKAQAVIQQHEVFNTLIEELEKLKLWKFLDLEESDAQKDKTADSTTPSPPSHDIIALESVLSMESSFANVDTLLRLPILDSAPLIQSTATAVTLSPVNALISVSPEISTLSMPSTAEKLQHQADMLRSVQQAVDALALQTSSLIDQLAATIIRENQTVAGAHDVLKERELQKRKEQATAATLAAASRQYSRLGTGSRRSLTAISTDGSLG